MRTPMGSDARRTRSSLDEWQPVVAIGSTHYVQIDRGDVVIAAVQKVLDAARSNAK